MKMIRVRQSAFTRRKSLNFSTPTVDGQSRIAAGYLESDQRIAEVPCPHCGEFQELQWEQVQWTSDMRQAWYVCAANGCVIDERHKTQMLAAHRWTPQCPEIRHIRGYRINGLYYPLGLGPSWRDLAIEWINAQADEDDLKQFVNQRLGRVWVDKRTAVKVHHLIERVEPYHLREVPPGCLLLTAGVDTQDNRLAAHIVGWGPERRWWTIDYVELPGSPARPEVWIALAELLNRPVSNAFGRELRVTATAIDMGGHHTEDVKAFTLGFFGPRLQHLHFPIEGSRYRLKQVIKGPRKTDTNWRGRPVPGGAVHFEVGTELAKDRLYADLRDDAELSPQERRAHFSADLEEEYFRQLTSETLDPKKNRYILKRGHRNEVLDTWVYAYAAAHHPNVRVHRMRERDWERLRQLLESDAAPAPDTQTESIPAPSTPRPERRGTFGKLWSTKR